MQHVLIVEDDPRMRSALVRTLTAAECEVVATADVQGALAQLEQNGPFDLIVLDVCLGGRSGVEIAEVAWRLNPAPAVVAISGRASRGEVFRLGQLGVRAFIDKSELVARLDDILEIAAQPSPLAPHVKSQVGHVGVTETLGRVREAMFEQALGLSKGSCAKAGVRLGVSRQAVQQMIERQKKDK